MVLIYIGIWYGICQGIHLFARIYDDAITEETRGKVALLLKRPLTRGLQQLPAIFVDMFDKLYGRRALSRRRFLVSVASSLLAVAVISFIWSSTMPNTWSLYQNNWSSTGTLWFVTGIVFFNLIPDYFSYLETRYVMGIVVTPAGLRRLLIWLLLDALATLALATLAAVVFGLVILKPLNGPAFSLAAFLKSAFVNGWTLRSPIGIFLWSTFLTSGWIWLCGLSAYVATILRSLSSKWRPLGTHFDVDNKPVQVLEVAAILLVTVMFALGFPLYIRA